MLEQTEKRMNQLAEGNNFEKNLNFILVGILLNVVAYKFLL